MNYVKPCNVLIGNGIPFKWNFIHYVNVKLYNGTSILRNNLYRQSYMTN